jgi:hypothetical protein
MKIKIDVADTLFSQWIRIRDKSCRRCGSRVEFNDKGLPISHQNSHYFGRSAESTRFDPENGDCLCWGCHQYWGSDDKEGYRNFKIKQLGVIGFKLLEFRHNSYKKKDRKFEALIWREALKKILKENE